MGKRELIALLNLSSWCLVIVVWLTVLRVCLQFVIVVFPNHTHYFVFSFKVLGGLLFVQKVNDFDMELPH